MTRPPARTQPRLPRVSLRAALIGLVALANLAVFGAGLLWAQRAEGRVEAQRTLARTDLLGTLVGTLVDARGNLRSAALLRWDRWDEWFEDVQIAHFPDLDDPGRPALGLRLDPLGAAGRDPRHDEAEVLAAMRTAAGGGGSVLVAGGVALPVVLPDGRPWGGCWLRSRRAAEGEGFLRQLLPWFIASTLVLTLATFSLVRGLVLEPVQRLADTANRIGRGELAARAGPTSRQDEVGQLVTQFDRMAEEVQGFQVRLEREVAEATAQARSAEAAAMTQRRLAATGELAAGVAHEINNPLGGLVNAVEVLGRESTTPERREEYLALVRTGLERIRVTVGRLLRLAPRETRTTRLPLGQPLQDALGLVAHRAGQAQVRLEVGPLDGEPVAHGSEAARAFLASLPELEGQPNELGQAILNLLVNALDSLEGADLAAPGASAPRIAVRVGPEGEALRIEVQDSGPGASAEVLERAGDAFFTTKDPGRGTGLGLAMVHGVAAAHRGRLELRSAPGEGFTAILLLARGAEAQA